MAAASPAQSNTGTGASTSFPGAHRTDTPPKTLRGLNKPKCIQCGNVARSRCPYQSCKSCCSKAQNPCHIHVLKANATFPEKTPASSSPLFNQQPTEPSTAGSSLRVASLRQLSNNFAQFSNVQMPVRSKKPLTKKDVAAINEWRFSKLKEFQNRNIEIENEAFDRYLLNISMLEEVFSVESLDEDFAVDSSSLTNPNSTPTEEGTGMMISEMKLKLRSNPARRENFRKRIQHIVDVGLKKLKKHDAKAGADDSTDQDVLNERLKLKGWQAEKAPAFADLNDKLSKARTEEDLKACLELKAKLHNPQLASPESEAQEIQASAEPVIENDQSEAQETQASAGPILENDQTEAQETQASAEPVLQNDQTEAQETQASAEPVLQNDQTEAQETQASAEPVIENDQTEAQETQASAEPVVENDQTEAQETGASAEPAFENDQKLKQASLYGGPNMFSSAEIDQELLNRIEAHFSSLEEIEDL